MKNEGISLVGIVAIVMAMAWGLWVVVGILFGTMVVAIAVELLLDGRGPRVGERVSVLATHVDFLRFRHTATLVANNKRPGEENFRTFTVLLAKLPNGNQTRKDDELCWSIDGYWYNNKSPTE